MGAYDWITGSAPKRALDNGALLVSGAYPRKGPKAKSVEEFTTLLGQRAAQREASLVSGNGPTIGNALVAGIQSVKKSEVFQYINIIPFKQHGTVADMTHAERSEYFHQVRQELISKANIVIFISGEKLSKDNQIVNSDTVYTEFSQAIEAGRYPIPIAVLGGSAAAIHERLRVEIKKKTHIYRELPEGLFDKLANADLPTAEVIDAAFAIADWLVEHKLSASSRRASVTSIDGKPQMHQRTISGSSITTLNSPNLRRSLGSSYGVNSAAASRQASYSGAIIS